MTPQGKCRKVDVSIALHSLCCQFCQQLPIVLQCEILGVVIDGGGGNCIGNEAGDGNHGRF